MFDRYHRTVQETQAPNLLPVMNLFLVLIPILFLGAAFFHVGVIPASLPAQAQEAPATETPVVTMGMTIAPDFIELSAASDTLEPVTLQSLELKLWRNEDSYDADGVQSHLKKVKAAYPESDTLVVFPHESLDYETLVMLLDVCREYASGLDAQGNPKLLPLFPVVVFSRFMPEAAEAPFGLLPEEGP